MAMKIRLFLIERYSLPALGTFAFVLLLEKVTIMYCTYLSSWGHSLFRISRSNPLLLHISSSSLSLPIFLIQAIKNDTRLPENDIFFSLERHLKLLLFSPAARTALMDESKARFILNNKSSTFEVQQFYVAVVQFRAWRSHDFRPRWKMH